MKILPVAKHDSSDGTQGARWRTMKCPHLINRRHSEVERNSQGNKIDESHFG